jgi:hypothetical protein
MRVWFGCFLVAALVGGGGCGDDSDASGDDAGVPADASEEPRDGDPEPSDAEPSDGDVGDGGGAGDGGDVSDPCEGVACAMNERCVVAGDAPSCACIPGFEEVDGACVVRGVACVVDENCGASGVCADGACSCRSGRVGDGFQCSTLASCEDEPEACDPAASCVDTEAGTACVCPAGLRGDGTVCRDAGYSDIWAGSVMTCGLRTDGIASCWGFRAFGTTTLAEFAVHPADEPGGSVWVDLGAGAREGCAIREDQTMWCGVDWDEQVGAGTDWSEVVASGGSWCAIATDGGLHCWGDNTYRQLGLGSELARVDEPMRVGAASWAAVTLGERHGCGIQADGTLWCWGTNAWGQMGPTASAVPIRIGAEDDWEGLSSARHTTCGLRAGGELWCFGDPSDTSGTPVRVGAETWLDLSVGAFGAHTCAVRSDGTLWCRGTSEWGAHGSGARTVAELEQVGGDDDWRRVSVGTTHTCALRSDGSAWCFGGNADGQLGNGAFRFQRYPVPVGAAVGWIDVASGEDFTCGIREGGQLACTGEIRAAVEGARHQPSFVDVGTETWTDVGANWSDVCAIRADGTLHCGPGREVAGSFAFDQVGTAADWESLFLRDESFCGIRAGGDLYCWGDQGPGFHGGTRYSEPTLVTLGGGPWEMVSYHRLHAVGLRTDGSLWDFDLNAQLGGDTDWRSVSVGYDDVCALKTDDSLWCWEDSSTTPVRVGTERWTDAELHVRTGCATRLDGTLWCWGTDTGAGETGTNVIGGSYAAPTLVSAVAGWTRVDRGVQTSFGLRGGALWAWGLNREGQLGTGTAWSMVPRAVRDVTR